MALTTTEFIRRFLLHTLPEGFQRIRYTASSAIAAEKRSWPVAVSFLPCRSPPRRPAMPLPIFGDRYEEITGTSLTECSACHHGCMLITDVIKAIKPCPSIYDTS
jgi:hypothetical protein